MIIQDDEAMKDSLQEQLMAARRTHILEAAVKVFAAKGFHSTTIKDIAREAGIADGTIYNYFENKSALLLGIFERLKAAAIQQVPATPPSDLREFVKAYLQQPLATFQGEHLALFRVIFAEMLVNAELRELYQQHVLQPTLQMAEPYLQHWAAQHNIAPLHMSLALRAIAALVLGLLVEYSLGDDLLQTHWDTLPDFLADWIVRALPANPPTA
jgi:AcrR family transcriptional regulator